MFKVYTRELEADEKVCSDCGCYILGKVIRNWEVSPELRLYCVDCIVPWLDDESVATLGL